MQQLQKKNVCKYPGSKSFSKVFSILKLCAPKHCSLAALVHGAAYSTFRCSYTITSCAPMGVPHPKPTRARLHRLTAALAALQGRAPGPARTSARRAAPRCRALGRPPHRVPSCCSSSRRAGSSRRPDLELTRALRSVRRSLPPPSVLIAR